MEYRARSVRKAFGGITALRGVDFSVRSRSVHALVGENGAGKSTLLKILAGALPPDSGTLELDGEEVSFRSTREALAEGIAIVSQELALFPDVDILGNLFPLGAPTRWGLVDRREAWRRAQGVLEDLGVQHPLDTPVGVLPLAEQQLVEIARAVIADPRVLILDEPTSALDRSNVDHVHAMLDVLRDRGVAVIYVSHILEDVMGHVDEITVLRDGAVARAAVAAKEVSLSEVITAMIGEALEGTRHAGAASATAGAPLQVVDLVVGTADGVSFQAAPGEIIGLAGLAGAGQHDVFEALAGLKQPESGVVRYPSGLENPRSIREAVRNGVAVVPGDRKRFGLHLSSPLWENVAHVRSFALSGPGTIPKRRSLVSRARTRIEQLRITTPGAAAPVSSLSGGNQQKVVFAKWAETEPSVILMDDPTRGIDIGGRADVWDLIDERARAGAIQLVLSSEPLELASICHRVLVFRNGRIATELAGERISHSAILDAMNRDAIDERHD